MKGSRASSPALPATLGWDGTKKLNDFVKPLSFGVFAVVISLPWLITKLWAIEYMSYSTNIWQKYGKGHKY